MTRTRAECREVTVVAGTAEAELGKEAPSGTCTDPDLAIFSLLLALRLAFPESMPYYNRATGIETAKCWFAGYP